MFIQLIAGKTIEEQIEELKKEIEKKKKNYLGNEGRK